MVTKQKTRKFPAGGGAHYTAPYKLFTTKSTKREAEDYVRGYAASGRNYRIIKSKKGYEVYVR